VAKMKKLVKNEKESPKRKEEEHWIR